MLSTPQLDFETVRAKGSIEHALDNGGCIVNIRAHEHKPNLFTVFVRVPRNDSFANMVWTNISQDHLATLQQAHPVPEDVHKITRAHGTLEHALGQGATIQEIHSHEHNNTFSVTVAVPMFAEASHVEPAHDMVYTGVSMETLDALAQQFPRVAEALANSPIEVFHASKFGELMNEAGSKITGWHKTKSGSYSVKVECGDGCERTFSSISEQHMMDYVPNFNPGSSQISL